MISPTEITLPGDGVLLAADRWDPSGPANGLVLLLHGGGQTRHSWRTTGRDVARHGWTAVAVDARGHGDSDRAPDGDYGMDALVADLHRTVESLSARPVLVGASMGGLTSLVAQGEDPGLARGLVLVDIAPRVETQGVAEITSFMRRGLAGFDSMEEAVAAVVAYNPHRSTTPNPDGLRKNLRERDGKLYWHWDPRLVEGRDGTGRAAADAADRYARARAAASAITVPTLLVRGVLSNVVSPEGAQELLDLIPAARLIDVAGAGHMVAGDDNDVFTGGLRAFLDAVDATF
ncbi:alpha/beta fold hydrolase [Pseudonocardia aurantiaca]